MRDLYFRSGDGFIFVYSVTSASTFKELSEMWQQLALYRQNTTVSVPLVLVGNKVDLVDERRVSSERGKLLAEEWGVPYIETSARTGDCVEDVFATVVRRIVENERQVKGDKEKRGWWSRRCSVL
jgi:small GTP-binding protein